MIAVTGATGQLGRQVISALLQTLPASSVIAAVRSPDKAKDLAARGVQVREADYGRLETLDTAFKGVEKLLLISSSEVGQRVPQHRAVIDAARRQGVSLVAYTSILRANTSVLGLASEHRETEAALKASGLPVVILRNGWYAENYMTGLQAALAHGVIMGSAGAGRIAAAARADYAAAAAAALTKEGQAGRVYELAGDTAFTMDELAAEIARQSGKPVRYQDMVAADYAKALRTVGLPDAFADLLADCDVGVSQGALFDDSRELSGLIGRGTTPLSDVVAAALSSL